MAQLAGRLTVIATVPDAVAEDPSGLAAAIANVLAQIVAISAVDEASLEVQRVSLTGT